MCALGIVPGSEVATPSSGVQMDSSAFREAALAPILARCYEGAAGMPKEAADRRAALLEASLVKEFPAAWGILAQARLKATDPACRRRLQEEQAALLVVMERAQPMVQARLQQGF